LKKRILVNNVSGLQTFHILRFTTFLLISVIFAKSGLSTYDLGNFEILLFIASVVSYFWMTGLIQSFLPLYNNNASFPGDKIDTEHRSPEIFNAFLLISFFSVFIFIFGHLIKYNVYVFNKMSTIPHVNLLLVYILISNPAHLIEYIYLLRNKSKQIIRYAVITYSLQLIVTAGPVLMGHGIGEAMWGLVIISFFRYLWLLALLKKYAEFKFSWPFMKSHLNLGLPLIFSTLLSGSAQYIDGLVVALKYNSDAFALFRYGAKELPLVVMLATGLHNAMLPEFYNEKKVNQSFVDLKRKSARLMHILFPVSTVFLFFSDFFYPRLFNENFVRSSDVFMVYILLIVSRLLFPQTILIGLKKTRVILTVSLVEIILNIGLSLYLMQFYGLVGVALATVIIFLLEKFVLIGINYGKLGIKPQQYVPIGWYLFYSSFIILVFVLIDRDIVQVFGR
jgi:O-antigen/teichoic acid export membrane protein